MIAVSRFMTSERLLLTRRQVGVEDRARQLAMGVQLVGDPERVVIDVPEVQAVSLGDEAHLAIGELEEDVPLRADEVAHLQELAPDVEEPPDDRSRGLR